MSGHAVVSQEDEAQTHHSGSHHTASHHSKTSEEHSHRHHAMSEKLKRLGFANASRMRLYGEEFEILGDPVVIEDDVVFFDAIEKKSRQPRRVRIPLTIVRMARTDRHAA